MKKVFFVLALLVPAFSAAVVKVDVKSRCGEHCMEESFELSACKESFYFECDGEIRTTVTLEKETAESADFSVRSSDRDIFIK